MEIRLKTAEELSDEYVTIEIRTDHREIVKILSDPPKAYNSEAAAEVLAENYRRARAEVTRLETELKRYERCHVCTIECTKGSHTPFQGRALVTELNAEIDRQDAEIQELKRTLAESRELVEFKTRVADEIDTDRAGLHEKIRDLTAKIREYDRDRHTERDRADQLSSRVKVMEREAREKDAELRRRASAFKVMENRYETLLAAMDKNDDSAAEAAALQSIAARDQLLAAATTRVESARSILAAPQVTETRDGIVTSKGTILSRAIGNALAALDA